MPPQSNAKNSRLAVTPPASSGFSISRIFAIPDIERLSDRERRFLRGFHDLKFPSPFKPLLSLTSRLGSPGAVELYQVFDLNGYSSSLYRSAIFVLMSYYLKSNTPSDAEDMEETTCYLDRYRLELRNQLLNNGSLVEVVYASYVVAIFSIVGGASIETAITYCQHFCKCFVNLTRQQKATDDWIELLWRDALSGLYYVHRNMIIRFSFDVMDRWEKLLGTSYCLLVSDKDIDNLPVSMTMEQVCHKIKSLSIYMQFYLDIFLIRTNRCEPGATKIEIARDRLYSIVSRITRLVSHVPNISDYIYLAYRQDPSTLTIHNHRRASNFSVYATVEPRSLKAGAEPLVRDTSLALIYTFARLLKNMLEPTADSNKSDICNSAIAICRLCTNLSIDVPMGVWIVKRSLIWAGLILTDSTYTAGNLLFSFFPFLTLIDSCCIKIALNDCIRSPYQWGTFAFSQEEEAELINELFQEADKCTSMNEIWKLGTGNHSLFYYTHFLTTWFFGLNLARFEHKPHIGRCLEISS